MDPDEVLLPRYVGGDRAALEALVRRYEGPLSSFIRRFLSDGAAVEEVFQETFIRVYRKAASFEEKSSFKSWLYAIALNLARNELRKRPKATLSLDRGTGREGRGRGAGDGPGLGDALPGDDPPPDKLASDREVGEKIRAAVNALREENREVFVLYQYEGLSYQAIADLLGRPLGTVKSQMHYALVELRRRLEGIYSVGR